MKAPLDTKVDTAPSIENFILALQRGVDAITDAAKILVVLVDKNTKIYDEIVKKHPNISYNMLANIERIGRGVLHPALLYDNSPGARKLFGLPISQQKALYDKTIDVARLDGDKIMVDQKRIQELSPKEANIIFRNSHVLTPEEQAKILREPKAPITQRYQILDDGSVIFLEKNVTFTTSQLEEILNRAKEQAKKTLSTAIKKKQIDRK